MSDIEDTSYIYVIGQHDDDGNILFNLPIKIGFTDKQDGGRLKKFKGEQFCINPKIVRLLKIKKIHSKPDYLYHNIAEQIFYLKRVSISKELFIVDNLDIVDKMFSFVVNMNSDFKYYKDQSEIEELLNKDTVENNNSDCIIDDICEKTINYMVSQVIAENSDNSENPVDNTKFMINLIKKAMENKPPKESNRKDYLGPTNIKRIILDIDNFSDFRYLIENNDKENIIKELNVVLDKLKSDNKPLNFPKAIIRCIIKMYK